MSRNYGLSVYSVVALLIQIFSLIIHSGHARSSATIFGQLETRRSHRRSLLSASPCLDTSKIQHVMTIVLENQDYKHVMKDEYLGSKLVSGGLLFTNYHGVTHPSQPNYVAMITGDTHGVSDDDDVNLNVNSIADLLEAKGLTWKSYQEDYKGNCNKASTMGRYARKHNPFISLKNIYSQPSRCSNIVPANQLNIDASHSSLPNYMFYTPNLDDDGHDTDVPTASAWLKSFLSPKLRDPLYASTLFFVTFDESTNHQPTNHIYSLLIGAGVPVHQADDGEYNHYSWLRTVEELFGLGRLGKNDDRAQSFHQCSHP